MKTFKAALVVAFFFVVSVSRLALAENAPTVPELKSQILTLAQSYQGQGDPDGSKKQSLDVLINKLLSVTPQKTMAEKAQTAVGEWHEIWGPYHSNDATKKATILDPANVYQVIFANNTYINVGVYTVLRHKIIGLLKGKYALEADQISIQFVENGILAQPVPEGKTLADLPALHEAGKIKVRDFPASLPPVGIKGSLHEIYSDDTLRLTYGVQEGKAGQTLYVLERVPASSN